MMDLEDFTPFLEPPEKQEEKEERTPEEIEAYYRKKILELQKKYQEEVKKAEENGLKLGFEEGYRKASEEWKAKLQHEVQKIKAEYEAEIKELRNSVSNFHSTLHEEERNYFKRLEKLLLDSIEEILNFLYISPQNAQFVKEKIEELIESFPEETPITIEVGRGLANVLSGSKIKISEDLEENDFRINFDPFSIESKIKEKLELLREEIEREIKKSSQI